MIKVMNAKEHDGSALDFVMISQRQEMTKLLFLFPFLRSWMV